MSTAPAASTATISPLSFAFKIGCVCLRTAPPLSRQFPMHSFIYFVCSISHSVGFHPIQPSCLFSAIRALSPVHINRFMETNAKYTDDIEIMLMLTCSQFSFGSARTQHMAHRKRIWSAIVVKIVDVVIVRAPTIRLIHLFRSHFISRRA